MAKSLELWIDSSGSAQAGYNPGLMGQAADFKVTWCPLMARMLFTEMF